MCTKTCNSCKQVKSVEDFHKRKTGKGGFSACCKVCTNEKRKPKREEIYKREKILPLDGLKKCLTCNMFKTIDSFSIYSESKDGLQSKCKECKHIYYLNNKTHINAKNKQYYEENKEKLAESGKKYVENNKEKINEYKKEWFKKKINQDSTQKLISNIRALIRGCFKRKRDRFKKTTLTENILGCSFEEFKNHIESQFESWMSWDNHGNCKSSDYNCTWHLDHIIPINWATTEEEVYMLNHWSNFQPLCNKKNLEKGSTIYPLTNLELKFTI